MRIQYTTTSFSRPIVDRQDYQELKARLSKNQQADIEPASPTIIERFKGHMNMFKYGGIGILVGLIAGAIIGEAAVIIYMPSFIVIMFTGIHLLMEAPSYATFKKKKTAFFVELKTAVINTTSYEQFDLVFNRR